MNEQLIIHSLYFVVFAPLISAILVGLFGRFLSHKMVSFIAVGAPFVAFAAALVAVISYVTTPHPEDWAVTATLYNWITVGNFSFDFSLYLDPLSCVMILVVTGVGSFIHLYSVGYMHDDPSYSRYFSHLNLFMFAMLLLVLGKSLLILFIGWEGVGLCSYLLIGFWFDDMEKAKAGKKAFIVNRIGDFGFLLGIFVILFWFQGSLDIQDLKESVTIPQSYISSNTTLITIVTLCLFLGATGKSAQIPLYIWLPDAMAGPTPVSALIHAATMVTAGVYMVARLNFLFVLAPISMAVVAFIGALTAVFAATIGLAQNDIKKVLAYSTVSQLGYMFVAVGVGAFSAGIFHLMTHAFFKACLFLGAGSVIHAMAQEQDIRKMGGLGKMMPITRATFLISTMAIAGVPLLSGFFSKDEILYSALTLHHKSQVVPGWISDLCFCLILLGAFITALYMFRLYFLTFSGELRSHEAHPHESPPTMTVTLIVLAVGAIFAGYVGLPFEGLNKFHDFLHPVFAWSSQHLVSQGSHTLEYGVMVISTIIAIGGIWLAYMLYVGSWKHLPETISTKSKGLYQLVVNKYYIDEIYDFIIVKPLHAFARWFAKWIDGGVIDKGMVEGPPKVMNMLGSLTRLLVNGEVQAYAAAILIAAFLFIWALG